MHMVWGIMCQKKLVKVKLPEPPNKSKEKLILLQLLAYSIIAICYADSGRVG